MPYFSRTGFTAVSPYDTSSKEPKKQSPRTHYSKMEVVDTTTAAAAAAETASSKQQKVDTDALTGKVAEYYNKKHVFDFYNQVRATGTHGTSRVKRRPGARFVSSLKLYV